MPLPPLVTQRYRDLSPEDAEFIKSQGENPADFVFDADTGNAVGREVLGPEYNTAQQIVAGLGAGREYLKGAAGSVLDTAQLPVRANLALREGLVSGLSNAGVDPDTAAKIAVGTTRGTGMITG